jgi:hypothetical protein
MKTTLITPEQVEALLKKYGTHERVAERLGITYRRWCQIRNKEDMMTTRRIAMIIDYRLGQQCNSTVES